MGPTTLRDVTLTSLLLSSFIAPLVDGLESYSHRSKRYTPYFFIHPSATITIGCLLNVPFSLGLPTIVHVKRSLGDDSPPQRLPGEEYPEEMFWEEAYQQQIGRLQMYFSYLKIPTMACQERLVCQMAANTDEYDPLSQLMLRELRQVHGPVRPSQECVFWRFLAASATGYAYGESDCGVYYDKCEVSAQHMLNMPMLKLLQYVMSILNMRLT